MTIKGIFFDAADVLYRRPERTGTYVFRLLTERGLSMELSAQDRMQQKTLRAQAKSGQLCPDEYWDRLLLMYGVADANERRVLACKIIDYSDLVLPIPGSREALTGLKQRRFVLGIVTDTIYPIERKQRWLDTVGVAEFIDVLACSTVLGAHKPEPAIYMNALQQAQLTPSESAFVGHAADELEGARRAGLATIAVYHELDARADYYAGSLVDLLNVPILRKTHQ